MSRVLSHRPVTDTRARYEADQALLPGFDAAHADIPSFTELAKLYPFGGGTAEASPAPNSTRSPHPGAGEVSLSPSQKVAILKLRNSDWSKAVLKHIVAFGEDECTGEDYRTLAGMKLAINKGSFHVLTQQGRRVADEVAILMARSRDMHVITYDFGSRGRAAQCKCVCGHRTFHSRAKPDWVIALSRSARQHLEHIGMTAREAVDDAKTTS